VGIVLQARRFHYLPANTQFHGDDQRQTEYDAGNSGELILPELKRRKAQSDKPLFDAKRNSGSPAGVSGATAPMLPMGRLPAWPARTANAGVSDAIS
jgi:hypothetical protein